MKEFSEKRIKLLLSASSEPHTDETILEEGLRCPACKNESLTAFSSFDVDYDYDGPSVHIDHAMRCRICDLSLDDEEIEQIIGEFDKFFGKDQDAEKHHWEQVIQEPDRYEEYA
ncbi:MAG: hypothetical protein WBE86_15370 [Candidatus Acidiferrales bacterium]